MAFVWDTTKQRWVNTDTGGEEVDPAFQAQNQQFDATLGQITAKKNSLAAGYGTLAATEAQLPYQQATLAARRGVLGAQQGTFGPQAQVISANRAVSGAQGAELSGRRGLLGQQQQENTTQRGEFEQVVSARDNVQDKVAVATMQRYNAARDSRARALGMQPEAEVDVPVGFAGKLGVGVRARPTTQEQDVTATVKTNQQRRGFDLEAAKLVVQLMGTDVDAARIAAQEAGFTLDEAQLAVKQAENAAGFAANDEDMAGMSVTRARLGESRARLGEEEAGIYANEADLNARLANKAPRPGDVKWVDPYTGKSSWVTPAEQDQLQYQYSTNVGNQRVVSDYVTKQGREDITNILEGRGGFGQAMPKTVLDAYSEPGLLDFYFSRQSITPPGGNVLPSKDAIVQALAQKLGARLKMDATTARAAAELMIQMELFERTEKARNAGPPLPNQSGGGTKPG